jgi:chitinase
MIYGEITVNFERTTHLIMTSSLKQWLIMLLLLVLAAGTSPAQAQSSEYRVVGYYTFYSIYELDYDVTDIPVDRLTHLIYAHIDITDTGQCASADEYADTEYAYPDDRNFQRLKGNFNQLQLLTEEHPDLTVMMSIGGWDMSDGFIEAAATAESRERFVNSCITFMQRYGFEGIDIDWRYPVSGGRVEGGADDSENFQLLMRDFRAALDIASTDDDKRYELSMTAPPFPDLIENFEMRELSRMVDFVNLMTYGYEGPWSDITGHIAPLSLNPQDPRAMGEQERFTVEGGVNTLLDAGVSARQIVVGVPLYGQAWQDVRPNDFFGLFSLHSGVPQGTRDGGRLYYRDLSTFINSPNYTRFFDKAAAGAWLYNEDARIAISYENVESLRRKAEFVQSMNLGGMMVWQLSYDDAAHTLLRTVAIELKE